VQCIGPDVLDGSSAQLTNFRDITGVSFPLLLNAATSAGGNIATLYGGRDDYVVISKQQIVRYHASLNWPFGDRYHLDELRGAIDTLVSNTTAVPPARTELRLAASPNPFHGRVEISLTLGAPVAHAHIAIFDVTGREVVTLHDGSLAPGETPFQWDGRDAAGAVANAGVFLVSAELDGRRLGARLARLP